MIISVDIDKLITREGGMILTGEVLRSLFFAQSSSESFALALGVNRLPDEIDPELDPEGFPVSPYVVAELNGITMRYKSDLDGYLEFSWETHEGTVMVLKNYDCNASPDWFLSARSL